MKNIIIVADSFGRRPEGWPNQLGALLGLNPVLVAQGAGSWWSIRDKLDDLDYRLIADAEYMMFVHPATERLNTTNRELLLIDKDAQDKTEQELAVHLHYKYVYDDEFARWAHRAWIKELQTRFSDKKLIHVHSFPVTRHLEGLFKGMVVQPAFTAISLCELGAKNTEFFTDLRPNHFTDHNNTVLAEEMARLISNYQTGTVEIDTSRFDLKTDRWLNWRY